MPQNDDTPKVMPDLGCLTIECVGYYRRFFARVEEIMVGALAHDPACDPVAVISPGLSPCIELTGLQWPSEFGMDSAPEVVFKEMPIQVDLSKFPPPPVVESFPEQTQDEIDRKLAAFMEFHRRQSAEFHAAGKLPVLSADDALEPSALVSSPAAAAPAAGVMHSSPPQAQAPAAGTKKGAPWTEEEDAQLIDLVADALARDFKTKLALEWAADKLGRPLPAVNFRVYHSLKSRIDARVAELRAEYEKARAAQKKSPAPKQTAPEPAGQVGAGGGGPQAAEVAAPPADGQAGAGKPEYSAPAENTPLTPFGEALAWLEKLDAGRAKTPFTMQHDHDLLHFHNLRWPLHEIAAEIGLTVEQCKMRHSALTQMKKLKAADVLAALLHLHPEFAQNAA